MQESRRAFNAQMLASVAVYGLLETLWSRAAFADSVKPIVGKWLAELSQLCQDVKGRKIKDTEWQTKIEELYKTADLPELCKSLDLEAAIKRTRLPDNGAASLGVDLSKVEGLPRVVFGKQIFALKKGRSIVPHGHSNMCTGFVILRGTFEGKHYDRVEDQAKHYLIRPTIDRAFKAGEFSTISDHKDNIHWFKATSDTGFIFNIHVIGYDPAIQVASGRLYLDPDGEKVKGGLIVAKKMSSEECHKKYG